jgi:hypothetical protein
VTRGPVTVMAGPPGPRRRERLPRPPLRVMTVLLWRLPERAWAGVPADSEQPAGRPTATPDCHALHSARLLVGPAGVSAGWLARQLQLRELRCAAALLPPGPRRRDHARHRSKTPERAWAGARVDSEWPAGRPPARVAPRSESASREEPTPCWRACLAQQSLWCMSFPSLTFWASCL